MNKAQELIYEMDEVELSINSKVSKEVSNLSSGTMAAITGLKGSSDLDKIQSHFSSWVMNYDPRLKDWKEAWKEFAKDFELKLDAKGNASPEDIKKKLLK